MGTSGLDLSARALHEREYVRLRALGRSGWGGEARMARGAGFISRMLLCGPVSRAGRVLELGCGEGQLARRLARGGYRVTGVDFSATAIGWAREKALAEGLDIEFVEADLTDPATSFAPTFDVVVDGNCLHCVIGDARPAFLATARDALAPGGVLYVSSACARDADGLVERNGLPVRQVNTLATLRRELDEAGLHVLTAIERPRDDIWNHANLYACRADSTAQGYGPISSSLASFIKPDS